MLSIPEQNPAESLVAASSAHHRIEKQAVYRMDFSYDTLTNPSESIRLLTIVPDLDEATVRCIISQYKFSVAHSHQQCPAYCAVSYTWSPLDPRQPIELNGQHLSIGYNLWLLLKQLRRAGKQGLLWVDALCINQANIYEKNAQVAIMRLIYYSASQVFAWLGEASPGVQSSDLAFEVEAGSDAILKKLNDDQEDGPPSEVYVKGTLGGELSMTSVRLWNAVAALFARDYWTRTWILQEISQKPESVIIHCGSHSIRLNTLRREIRRAVNKLRNFLQYGKVLSSDPDMDMSDLLTEQDMEKDRYCSGVKQQLRKSADTISKHTLLAGTVEWNELPLLTWFQIASHTFCSDPRDKVYSLVDLANGAPGRRTQFAVGKGVKFI